MTTTTVCVGCEAEEPMEEFTTTDGREHFVVVGTQRGGTRIHVTDDEMIVPSHGISTSHVKALCGLDTWNATPYDMADFETDAQYLTECPRCRRIDEEENR